MNKTRIATQAFFAVAIIIIGSLISLYTMPGEWYQGLVKPSFNPPNWLFGPVWTLLYIMVGIAGGRTWLDRRSSISWLFWIAQMVFNFLWTPAFFGLHSLGLGLVVIVPMWLSIAGFIATSWRDDRTAALLFVPYLAWVSFAALLNVALFLLN